MPAETHQHTEPLTADDVIALLFTVVGDSVELDPSTTLVELGMTDDLDLLAFWDAAVEEFAERTIGEPDLTELLDARTAAELAAATVACLLQPATERG